MPKAQRKMKMKIPPPFWDFSKNSSDLVAGPLPYQSNLFRSYHKMKHKS